MAELKLTSYASLWFEGLQKTRRKDGKARIDTWRKLKRELKNRFVPHDYGQNNYLKLHSLKQNKRNIDEYMTEFEKMNMLCNLDETEDHKVATFVAGLNDYLKERVELQPYWTFEEVCKVEKRGMKVATKPRRLAVSSRIMNSERKRKW